MLTIPAADPRLSWHGAIDLEHGPGWIQPWRLPVAERGLFHRDLVMRAGCATGVRLAVITESSAIGIDLVAPAEDSRPVALLRDDVHVADAPVLPDGRVRFPDQPPGQHRYELWLPQNVPVRVAALVVDDAAEVAPAPIIGPRWITYGSSISQCNAADSPARTWPARVAHAVGAHLTCLGFGGQCHLDPLVARVIAKQPADVISLKVGINIYGQSSLGPRTFQSNLIAFVRLIREAHPTIPLAMISPIFSHDRETVLNKVDLNLQLMREHVAEAVTILRNHGDANLHHLSGLELLGPDDHARLPDFLHPDTAGYGLMAERFVAKMGSALFGVRTAVAPA